MDRIKELIEYINLLVRLEERGYKCENKLADALSALHIAMGLNAELKNDGYKTTYIPHQTQITCGSITVGKADCR